MPKKDKEPKAPYDPKILGEDELQTALDDGQKHRADIKTLDARKDQIDADIIATLFSRGEAGLKGAPQGTWAIENKITRTINRAKLVAAGVDPATIDECTDESVSDPYLKLYPKRGPKDETKE